MYDYNRNMSAIILTVYPEVCRRWPSLSLFYLSGEITALEIDKTNLMGTTTIVEVAQRVTIHLRLNKI